MSAILLTPHRQRRHCSSKAWRAAAYTGSSAMMAEAVIAPLTAPTSCCCCSASSKPRCQHPTTRPASAAPPISGRSWLRCSVLDGRRLSIYEGIHKPPPRNRSRTPGSHRRWGSAPCLRAGHRAAASARFARRRRHAAMALFSRQPRVGTDRRHGEDIAALAGWPLRSAPSSSR